MRYFNSSPMYYHTSLWPEGFISLIINVLFWVALVSFVLFLFRKLSNERSAGCCGICSNSDHEEGKNNTYYLDIVKERYAKGEIDKKQYEELKKDLADE